MAELERLRDEEQRLREMASFGDWQRKEEDFHLEQTKERSRLRLTERRDRPMDRIVKNLLLTEVAGKALAAARSRGPQDSKEIQFLHLDAELQKPHEIISRLHLAEVDALLEDVLAFEQLDALKGQAMHAELWANLRTIATTRRKTLLDPDRYGALHASIVENVRALLRGKSIAELNALTDDITQHLAPGKAVDVDYWELLLDEVLLQRAKADTDARHLATLQQWADLLVALKAEGIVTDVQRRKDKDSAQQAKARPVTVDDLVIQQYLRDANVDLDGEEDDEDVEIAMDASEEVALTSVPSSAAQAGDKYLPRKPRYFNRVRTGWDRTKYNLTHYDHDNPPPKIIQGYKFTIFYPDLLDKSRTPRYVLERCADSNSNDFVIIRFSAGPPYEDIAFKILNKEWDRNRRSGFVCVFDRGVLQVNFNFKRVFYRR